MTEFLTEDQLQGLTKKELEKEANKYIYQSGISERASSHPVLRGSRIRRLKQREISVPTEELGRLANGEHIDPIFFKK